jgi:outer membrane protein TolC
MRYLALAALAASLSGTVARAALPVYSLRLHDAEIRALVVSHQVRAASSDKESADQQAQAQFTNLLPKLTLSGNYQYFGTLPLASLGPFPPIPFGVNSIYNVGPTLSYTLWDTFSNLKAYQGASRLEESKGEDLKTTELQILYSLRNAYIQVQLALEELRLTNDSLALSRAQDTDVTRRYRAGSASRLDLVTADRSVINYELQYEQRQADLSSALRDLLAILDDHSPRDISHPGLAKGEHVTLALDLDPLEALVGTEAEAPPPDETQPQIKSLSLQGESAERQASSQSAKLFPIIQVSGGIYRERINGPNIPEFTQETVTLSMSMPLYLGDPTPHLVSQQRANARAAFERRDQTRINIDRDYFKAKELLRSLREQREVSMRDIVQSAEAARLYYLSYKAGKNTLLDVQNADVQALLSKVSRARIDAQILSQLTTLQFLSGKELRHE